MERSCSVRSIKVDEGEFQSFQNCISVPIRIVSVSFATRSSHVFTLVEMIP